MWRTACEEWKRAGFDRLGHLSTSPACRGEGGPIYYSFVLSRGGGAPAQIALSMVVSEVVRIDDGPALKGQGAVFGSNQR